MAKKKRAKAQPVLKEVTKMRKDLKHHETEDDKSMKVIAKHEKLEHKKPCKRK